MTFDQRNAVRAAATVVAVDARALVVVVNVVIIGLALILSTGAEWQRAT